MIDPSDPKSTTYGLGDPLMLERIDKLFRCGVAEHVNLPQIVVVGDQSSGKSSVLEGLIKKPLPRDSGLCTRFATMIVFRRAIEPSISVSIIADQKASPEHRIRVQDWKKEGLTSLEGDAFADIMDEVHEVMDLFEYGDKSGSKPTFSSDVLRLEISGPDQEHLSVIDVPGIFKNTTPGVTTKDDIALVRKMVLEYMENPRSVMLTVIPANVDVATQEILELARDVDPESTRTLGVLTKPDLVDKGAEGRVIDMVEGRARVSKLGWHVVRNPGQVELENGSFDRNDLEKQFFRSHPAWKTVASDCTGIETLRARLKDVLSGLIRKEFPKVQQEVSKKLATAQSYLKDLGQERSTSVEQTAFLVNLAVRFQNYVDVALDAKYSTDDLFERVPDLKIAPILVQRIHSFEKDMAEVGHLYHFLDDGGDEDDGNGEENKHNHGDDESPESSDSESTDHHDNDPDNDQVKHHDDAGAVPTRKVDGIIDICPENVDVSLPIVNGIRAWLKEVYLTGRGFELGTFDPAILAAAFKKQTFNWPAISMGCVGDVADITHTFVTTVLKKICPDDHVYDALYGILSDDLMARYQAAVKHVEFLLIVERDGKPMTVNHYFSENLEKSRKARVLSSIESSKISSDGKWIRLADLAAQEQKSNTEHIVRDIHDMLKSYYKVARKRYVDQVIKSGLDYFLMTGPNTPLRLFSSDFIAGLSPEQIEHVAGEASHVKQKRARLAKEIASLSEAKKILARG